MAAADGSGEIIIKGGSCEIHFDDGVFTAYTKDGKQNHMQDELQITQIVVEGNRTFDSGKIDGGFYGEIRIMYYRPQS